MKEKTILFQYNIDNYGNPTSTKIKEVAQVSPLKYTIQLEQIPDEQYGVTLLNSDNTSMVQVFNYDDVEKIENSYYVNYTNGIVYFNSVQGAEKKVVNYYGTGVELISCKRVFDGHYDANGKWIVEILQDIIDAGREAIDIMSSIGDIATILQMLQDKISEGQVIVGDINDKILEGQDIISDIEEATKIAQDAIDVTENEIKIISTSDWIYNSTTKMYEYTITHTMNSTNLIINCYNNDTNEFVFCAGKIIDTSSVLIQLEESINLKVVLNARYYKASDFDYIIEDLADELQNAIDEANDLTKVTGNEEVIISASDWIDDGNGGYYAIVNHNCNSENIHVTFKRTATKENMTLGYTIIGNGSFKVFNHENITTSCIISAMYYRATQTISDDIAQEVVQARGGKNSLNDRFEDIASKTVVKKINPKLLPPPCTRAIGDGVTNDTVAFNTALSLLCTRSDSNIVFETRCGVLELDEGVYVVDEILCRSNLTIRGQGIGKTILIPNINDIDKFFLDVKYTGENKLCNFELENLSILKTLSHQFILEPVTGRKECSILNLTKCTSVRIRNVMISGFKGNGILFKESFDTNIDNLQMLGCGDETHDAIMITSSESDGSNALHFNAIRVEGCSAINIEATGNRFNREIQFIGGKYEHVPFKIQGSSNVNFCGGHFTYGKIDTPLLRINPTAEAETYGINFTGCSFIGTNTGYLANITPGANPPKFVGCSFKGFAKGFVGDNIALCANEFYDMTAPIINSVANISADNNEFTYTKGTDGEYLFRIGANSNFNCNKIKYNANENLNGCLISNDGNYMTFNSFLTCNTAIRVEGSLNLLFGNKGSISEKEGAAANTLGHFSSLYVPTNSLDIPQNIRFNPTTNKLELFRKSSNSWGETYVRAGNVANLASGSTLEATVAKINEIITALKHANLMIP